MPVEIPAVAMQQMTGRCGRHQRALELVPYADDGLNDALDAWCCPGIKDDPELEANRLARGALDERWGGSIPWDRRPQPYRDEWEQLMAEGRAVWERCQASWVFTVPVVPVVLAASGSERYDRVREQLVNAALAQGVLLSQALELAQQAVQPYLGMEITESRTAEMIAETEDLAREMSGELR